MFTSPARAIAAEMLAIALRAKPASKTAPAQAAQAGRTGNVYSSMNPAVKKALDKNLERLEIEDPGIREAVRGQPLEGSTGGDQ